MMNITIIIDDDQISGFSQGAKKALNNGCQEYAQGIIEEAKRIEQSDRITGQSVEVIASHVSEARRNYRRSPRRKTTAIIMDVILEILLIVIGAMFSKDQLLNSTLYLIVYIALALIIIVLLVIKYSRGA